jgi:hypothetical protein
VERLTTKRSCEQAFAGTHAELQPSFDMRADISNQAANGRFCKLNTVYQIDG